jgi:hypothetical protein
LAIVCVIARVFGSGHSTLSADPLVSAGHALILSESFGLAAQVIVAEDYPAMRADVPLTLLVRNVGLKRRSALRSIAPFTSVVEDILRVAFQQLHFLTR